MNIFEIISAYHSAFLSGILTTLQLSAVIWSAGVTVGAVFQWEKGNFEPKDDKKKILVGLRKLGRKEARKLLEEKRGQAVPKENLKVSRKRKRKDQN